MLTLWKHCHVYAPEDAGLRDILMEGAFIRDIRPDLSMWEKVPGIMVMDMKNAVVCPGLVDSHVHVTGGGGEQGPASRTPELSLTDFTLNGVTTVLGLLGTDGISRSLENLLFKCRALDEEGISTVMLTGNYRFPSPTLTGDVERDIALIDKIIGVKIALSDHRSSAVSVKELARLGTEARLGGMISGKAGIVVLHMGHSPKRLQPLFEALEQSDVPPSTFIPTHCARTPALLEDAVRFNKMGGTIDFTAGLPEKEGGTAAKIAAALSQGADISRITMSSDAGGSQPIFDAQGVCTGLGTATSSTLLEEVRRMTVQEGMTLSDALRPVTCNPARVLGLQGKKGVIAPQADADLLVLDDDLHVKHLMARGKMAVKDGQPLIKGRFQ